jgi:hypothetical protein
MALRRAVAAISAVALSATGPVHAGRDAIETFKVEPPARSVRRGNTFYLITP